jgi:hypothetical protein
MVAQPVTYNGQTTMGGASMAAATTGQRADELGPATVIGKGFHTA